MGRRSALPRPFAVLHQLLQPQARKERIEDLTHGFLRGLLARVSDDFRILRGIAMFLKP